MNTLCSKDVLTHKDSDDANTAHIEEGVKIKPVTVGMLPLTLERNGPSPSALQSVGHGR